MTDERSATRFSRMLRFDEADRSELPSGYVKIAIEAMAQSK